MFRGWAQQLSEAAELGEDVPDIQDVDAVVEWLEDRLEIKPPLTTEHARVLIEACVKGGILEVEVT